MVYSKLKSPTYLLRAWLPALLLCIASVPLCTAQDVSGITFPRDHSATVAYLIKDLVTGEVTASRNPDKAMMPASTMKCVTTAAAMLAGVDKEQIPTDVVLHGTITDSILHGDLVIYGAGDPTTDSSQFPEAPGLVSEIAYAVKKAGIRTIEGLIVVDDSRFPDNGPCDRWEVTDLRQPYGCGLYSVNYRDNTHGSRSMSDPEESFGEALENRLNNLGITVDWNDFDTSELPSSLLLTHNSPQCDKIMSNLMKRSDNLFAEAILRRLAPGRGRDIAIAREKQLLEQAGIALDIADIYDGSGLSRTNRLSASTLTNVLSAMAKSPNAEKYTSFFPVVGREGTVKQLLNDTPLEGELVLKSGSVKGVHCYAGYKLDDNGKPTHTVVIFVNDFFCKRDQVRSAIADFLLNQFDPKTPDNNESDN